MKRSKNYTASKAQIVKDQYTLAEALELLPKTSTVKFDPSVELHVNTGLDPKHADQILRVSAQLPNGTGKKFNVIAFVPEEMVAEAKKAGAIEAGLEELVAKIAGGWMDFDMAVAHPSVMKNLGKIAKQLGQARKMPSPKSGTVSDKPAETIESIMKGKIEIRTDKFGCLHNIVGKLSFGADKLQENIEVITKSVKANKPAGSKGNYLKSVYLTTSMGPSIPLNISEL
jgi:large subunit ribosomal protein L1